MNTTPLTRIMRFVGTSIGRPIGRPTDVRGRTKRERVAGPTSALVALAALSLVASGCAMNPATGERELSLVSEEQEIEMGRAADPAATAEFGGLYPDDDLQRYVSRLGQDLAAASERPHLPWSFKVVDHELINAFALPGGFIYITRGILSHMNSEAELVAVLGHEVGHVTARHTARQITRQQVGLIGLIGGSIFSETIRDNAGTALQGMQLLFLKHGRDAEREADALGFRYMTRTGHHPEGMSDVMRTLDSAGQSASDAGIPGWLSTHPDPGDRVEANERRIESAPDGDLAGLVVRRDEFLRNLDGMTFGEDPRQGFFLGTRFVQPTLRFELDFPSGWELGNSPQTVRGIGPDRDVALELSFASGDTPAEAMNQFTNQEGVQVSDARRTAVNGLEAATALFRVTPASGSPLAGRVLYVALGGHVYQLLAYTEASKWSRYSRVTETALNSFRRMDPGAFTDVRPHRIQIVRLDRAMTGEEFVRAYPSTVPAEDVFRANQIQGSTRLAQGRLMKRITGGRIGET